jgi:heat shock protein HtpX
MRRIGLFLLTNLAVIVVLGIVLRLLGVDRVLDESGSGLDYTKLLIFAAVFGFGGSFISLAMSKWMAKRSTGAEVITQPRNETERWLLATVERQAKQVGIKMPEVAIFHSPDPNAFATGMTKNSSLVAVSSGLLQHMSADEVEAVLGHEMAHVANGDMVTLALVQGVVNTFVIFLARVVGHTVDRLVFKTEEGHGIGYYVVSFVAEIVFAIAASVIVAWVSRQREFRADAGGAALAGRMKMIAALERLRAAHPQPLPGEMAAFGISGIRMSGLKKLFSTHPPLEQRIEALRNQTH